MRPPLTSTDAVVFASAYSSTLLALVAAHEFGGRENVTFKRAVELVTVRPGLEVELGVERVGAEEVPVATARWAGAGVADRAEALRPSRGAA